MSGVSELSCSKMSRDRLVSWAGIVHSLLSDLLPRGSSEVIILGLYWLGTVLKFRTKHGSDIKFKNRVLFCRYLWIKSLSSVVYPSAVIYQTSVLCMILQILAEIHAMLTEPCNEGNLVRIITKTPRLTNFSCYRKWSGRQAYLLSSECPTLAIYIYNI